MTNETERTRVEANLTIVDSEATSERVTAELNEPDPDKETTKARLDENS